MPYSVQHRYFYDKNKVTGEYRKEGTVFLGIKPTLLEANALVQILYAGRFVGGREYVEVLDENGVIVAKFGVDYMAQFEPLPGKVWFTQGSAAQPYKTQFNTTGIVSCNCRAWVMGWKKTSHPLANAPYRHCKHTDDAVRKEGASVEVRGQYLMLVNKSLQAAKQKFATAKTKPAERFAQLIAEYEAAINIMAALDPSEMYQAAAAVEVAKFKVESYMLLLEEHGIDGSASFLAAEAKLKGVKQAALSC